MKQLSDSDFDAEVLKSDIPVVVDFWAAWCGPCRMLAPTIEELAGDNEDKVKVCKANTDDCPEHAQKYGVTSIPCVLFFKNGEEVERMIGLRGKDEFQKVIDGLL